MPIPKLYQPREGDNVVGHGDGEGTRVVIVCSLGGQQAAAWLQSQLHKQLSIDAVVAQEGQQQPAGVTLTVALRLRPAAEASAEEAYSLDGCSRGGVCIQSCSPQGLLRGASTLLQLLPPQPGGYHPPAAHIDDAPRFPWRGVMLDVR